MNLQLSIIRCSKEYASMTVGVAQKDISWNRRMFENPQKRVRWSGTVARGVAACTDHCSLSRVMRVAEHPTAMHTTHTDRNGTFQWGKGVMWGADDDGSPVDATWALANLLSSDSSHARFSQRLQLSRRSASWSFAALDPSANWHKFFEPTWWCCYLLLPHSTITWSSFWLKER